MQSEVYLLQKDTTKAITSLEKSLELDAYNGNTWAMRSMISLAREEWKEGEGYLNKAIHLLPKQGGLYINRALARVNQNNAITHTTDCLAICIGCRQHDQQEYQGVFLHCLRISYR
jgi:tetratricopeptide (TPR) repeat protein